MVKQNKEKIIGIDLGTSNSQASVILGGKSTTIPSAEGSTLYGKAFPSVVAFTKDEQLIVGEPARRQAVSNPEGTITEVKRKMGTDYKYKIHEKEYTPQQISAYILQKIKRDAESFLGEKVKKAVITVPAYFNDNQRTATKDAGKIAGLEVVRLINEPTAASIAYGLDKKGEEYKILVFDFGGGTLDVTVMELGDGTFNVLATSGDTNLGGTDMDNALVDHITEEFKKQEGIDLKQDKMAIRRVREAAEKAKIELSTVLETEVNLPYITATKEGPKHLAMKITRAKLEQLAEQVIERCKDPIQRTIRDSKLSKDKIDKVILIGGPTRMPLVQKFIENFVEKKPERGIDPMECVASGAAIQGSILSGESKDLVLLDVTPLTLGIETMGGVMTPLIEKNTTIPIKKSKIFSTATDSQTAVTIHVLQGERSMAKDNTSLGHFSLVGIPPAPRGVPQIEVTFDIDSSGILNVSAKDKGTGKEQKMTITASTKLSDEEVERMTKEAKKHEEEDKRRKDEVEIRNNADSIIYTTEKTLSELGDKLPKQQKQRTENKLKELKDISKEKDVNKIKEKTEELTKVVQEAGASVYQQAQQQTGQGESKKEEKPKHEKTVDAEYKDENEDKK